MPMKKTGDRGLQAGAGGKERGVAVRPTQSRGDHCGEVPDSMEELTMEMERSLRWRHLTETRPSLAKSPRRWTGSGRGIMEYA